MASFSEVAFGTEARASPKKLLKSQRIVANLTAELVPYAPSKETRRSLPFVSWHQAGDRRVRGAPPHTRAGPPECFRRQAAGYVLAEERALRAA